jgi:hypothetical protein
MIELIKEYKNGKLKYSSLVHGLEGIMDASDIPDNQLKTTWYDLWAPLEELNAVYGDKARRDDAIPQLDKLEKFLKEQCLNNL